MLKRLLAILAVTAAMPAWGALVETEDNGSILLADGLGLAGDGVQRISGAIGNNGGGRGDYDFFNLGRFAAGGNIAVTMRTTFDPFIVLYDSAGAIVAYNDDYFGLDSYFSYRVNAENNFYLAIQGFGSGLLSQPFDATSGGISLSTGDYDATIEYVGALAGSAPVVEAGLPPVTPPAAPPVPAVPVLPTAPLPPVAPVIPAGPVVQGGAPFSVPEPSGLAAGALAALWLVGLRRRGART